MAILEPRLTIELVPSTCWFTNVRDRVSGPDWNRIRSQVYERAHHRCEVCGGRGNKHPVECHEIWDYDDAENVQRLVGMVALCPACHEVKHIGLAGIKGRGAVASAHLAQVNGWFPDFADRYIDEAFDVWQQRSARPWTLDVSALEAFGVKPTTIGKAHRESPEERARTAAVITASVQSGGPPSP